MLPTQVELIERWYNSLQYLKQGARRTCAQKDHTHTAAVGESYCHRIAKK